LRESDSALEQEVLIADDDFVVASSDRDDAFSGGVMKLGGIFKNKLKLSRPAKDGFGDGMFGARLGDGGSFKQKLRGAVNCHGGIEDFGSAEGKRTGLVKEDGVDFAEFFEIETAFDYGALLSGAPDGAENRKRRARSNAAGSGDDHYGNGGPDVVRDEKREDRCAKREIDEVAREAISNALYGSAGFFGSFDGFKDFAEGGFAAETLDVDFECAGLIDTLEGGAVVA
jgi:hypothetical protein